MQGWVSPRLKIRFEIIDGELQITRPDGQRFLTYVELVEQHQQAQREKEQALQLVQQQAAELARLRERLKALGQSGNG